MGGAGKSRDIRALVRLNGVYLPNASFQYLFHHHAAVAGGDNASSLRPGLRIGHSPPGVN
jgi:hypothetical protein